MLQETPSSTRIILPNPREVLGGFACLILVLLLHTCVGAGEIEPTTNQNSHPRIERIEWLELADSTLKPKEMQEGRKRSPGF